MWIGFGFFLSHNSFFKDSSSFLTSGNDDFKVFIILLIYNIFKEKVEKDYEDYYKISIAISNILLKNQDINCLKYPSVANNNKMYNYGIKPEFVDKYLFCKDVYVFRVNILSNKLVLTPICHSSNLSPNGEELKFIRFNEFEKDNNFRMYELD